MSALHPRLAAAALALLFALAPGVADASVAAQIEPGYSATTTEAREPTGAETRADTETWLQRYRLTIDQRLYPTLSFSAGGNLNWVTGESRSAAATTESDSRTWNTYARLTMGGPLLNGALDYSRRWEEGESRIGGVTTEMAGIVRETFAANASWRPADLPSLSLRLSRSNAYDDARANTDVTSDEAVLSAIYAPAESVDARYSLRYGGFTDHLSELVRNEVGHSAAVTYTERFLSGRGNMYVGYNVNARTTDTSVPGDAGPVAVQKLPEAGRGLSIVEVFPDTPLRVTLTQNAALVDGDTGTSAGVNLGTAAGAGPNVANRDLGAKFPDVVTPVSEIHVFVHRTLPADLAALFTFEAYASDNNLDWTPIAAGTDPVDFNPVLFRFKVPIARTTARYLKVVTRPLLATATTDRQYQEIFVTELQFMDVVPADQVRGVTSDFGGNLSGTTRIVLVPELGLSYDFSGLITHGRNRPVTWSVTNGASIGRRLGPVYAASGRVERSDADIGRGWEAQNRWSASMSADPLPTFGAVASYSGQLSQLREGDTLSHSGSVSARADVYEGIAVSGTGSASWSRGVTGAITRSLLASGTTSIVPNRFVSLSGSISYVYGTQSGGGLPETESRRGFLEGSVSLSPFPALALSGSVTRQFGGDARAVTTAAFSGGFSPFPGGDLQLRYGYAETYDGGADARTRGHGPTARWNIRTGWALDAGYSLATSSTPASHEESRSFNANLLITLR